MLRPRRLPLFLVAVLVLCASSAQAIKLVDWNTLNYPNASASRNPSIRTVWGGLTNADLVAVQEVQSQSAMTAYQGDVLNTVEPMTWLLAPYFDNSNFNQGSFYRFTTMELVEADTIGNSPRCFPWYRYRVLPYTGSGAELYLIVVHLKASNTAPDIADRAVECQRIRGFMNSLPAGTNIVLTGDCNIYTSSEPGYTWLTGSLADNDGRLHDPINSPGDWNNNFTFRFIHTQSPRTADLGDGGITGGLDDRFDLILTSASLIDGEGMDELPLTYRTFNDGNHFNASIIAAPTISEGATMANALHVSSDHLPVWMEFQVPARVSVASTLPFGTVIVGATAQQSLAVTNIATTPADELTYSYAAPAGFTAPGGTLLEPAGGGSNSDTITMLTASAGTPAGNLTLTSDDVDTPVKLVALSGTVKRHAVPSLAATVVVADTVDLGTHAVGDFSDTALSVHNVGYDALQAALAVSGASIVGGGGRFSLVGGFSPVQVQGTPAAFTVAFNDTGASGPYTATLTFATGDEPLPGATSLANLVVTLTATVNDSSQNAVGDNPFSGVTVLRGAFPNPFAGASRIRFDLAEASSVSLDIFDVQGRSVRGLLRGQRDAGPHEVTWDGRSDDGRDVSPGLYFLTLDANGTRTSRRVVKIR